MNIKRIVLFSLAFYVIGAMTVLFIGFFFGEPNPGVDPAQSLLQLNSDAQDSIASRTNEQVDQIAQTESDDETPAKVAPPTEVADTTQAAADPGTTTPTPTPTPDPTPTPTPDPTPTPACGSGGTCTVAGVAAHGSQSDCWVMMGSKAYSVTSYVNQHNGGSGAFDSSTCGHDITAQMNGTASSNSLGGKTKNHSQGAYNTLNSYFIANIAG